MGARRATPSPSDAAIQRAWLAAFEVAVEEAGGEEKFARMAEEIVSDLVNAMAKHNKSTNVALVATSIAGFVVGYIQAAKAMGADCGRAVQLQILEAVLRVKIGGRDARS